MQNSVYGPIGYFSVAAPAASICYRLCTTSDCAGECLLVDTCMNEDMDRALSLIRYC